MPSEIQRGTKLEQESLLPELLHALSQPLTSLRCSLEVTLLQPRDSEEYRKRLRESLKLTEDITVLSRGIRELMDVEQAGNPPGPVALDRVLRSVVRELLPLADEQGIALSLLCAPSLKVTGDEQQFFTAVLYFLSFLLNLAGKGDDITIQASVEADEVSIAFETSKGGSNKKKAEGRQREVPQTASAYLKLLVARRIFELAGGAAQIERSPERIVVQARLPRLSAGQQEISAVQEALAQKLAPTG